MHRLAIYDMDRTITRAGTWTPFLLHTLEGRQRWRVALLPLAVLLAAGYAGKLYSRGRLKELTHRLMLGRTVPAETLKTLSHRFAERTLEKGVFADAVKQIQADRAEGRTLVLATASYRFYAAEIAARLGFDHVIATDSKLSEAGALLPRIDGENCYGPGKLRMIQSWYAAQGLRREDTHVRFYSDHVSDAPVFEWSDEPVAVNAHAPLRLLAKARGWRILDWAA